MQKHSKHSKIARPNVGQYGRNEFAILGAPCNIIKNLVERLSAALSENFNISYVDASHNSDDLENSNGNFYCHMETHGAAEQIIYNQKPSSFQSRQILNEVDINFINGNHFRGEQQIIILDPKKLESLERKVDRLTNVALILKNGLDSLPTFLENKVNDVPIFELTEIDNIIHYLNQRIAIPPIYGLVLSGGKSSRMGSDKAKIDYHGVSQLDRMVELVSNNCEQTFVSVNANQVSQYQNYNTIEDSFLGLGAYGGILSAFQKYPDAAWLVLAIDMPNIDDNAIRTLIDERKVSKVATAYLNPETNFPDPLFTIFEPKSYARLLHYLSLGYSCPRKLLINENVHVISSSQKDLLLNINTVEEKNKFLNDR